MGSASSDVVVKCGRFLRDLARDLKFAHFSPACRPHIPPDLVLEDHIDESLVGGPDILQSEGHYPVAVKALRSHKGCVLLVFRRHSDLIVSGKGIHEAEQSISGRCVYQLVDFWKWKAVLRTGAI